MKKGIDLGMVGTLYYFYEGKIPFAIPTLFF